MNGDIVELLSVALTKQTRIANTAHYVIEVTNGRFPIKDHEKAAYCWP